MKRRLAASPLAAVAGGQLEGNDDDDKEEEEENGAVVASSQMAASPLSRAPELSCEEAWEPLPPPLRPPTAARSPWLALPRLPSPRSAPSSLASCSSAFLKLLLLLALLLL